MSFTDIPGATGPQLTIPNAQLSNSGEYQCVITSEHGQTQTIDVLGEVLPLLLPSFTDHPQSASVDEGDSILLTATSTGTLPITHQWQFRPFYTGEPYQGQTLTSAEAGQWYISDVAVPGETGDTFVVPETVLLGDEIRCGDFPALTVIRIPGSWGARVDTTRTTEKTTDSDQFHMMGRSGVNETITIYWGDGTKSVCDTWDHADRIHTYADEGVYDVQVVGVTTANFRYPTVPLSDLPKIVSIDQWGNPWGSVQSDAFWATGSPFKFGELPFDAGTGLNSIVNASHMFNDQSITSIPDDMTLPLLEVGTRLFRNNNLTKIPDGMVLDNLVSAAEMFNTCNLHSLPSGMTLESLVNGTQMFRSNQNLKTLPLGMSLESLTNGAQMFIFCTLDTDAYSGLLIRMEANNPNANVVFHGGNSKYNSAAAVARAELLNRGWTITDGGPE